MAAGYRPFFLFHGLPAMVGFFVASAYTLLVHYEYTQVRPYDVVLLGLGSLAFAAAALALRWLSFWSLAGSPGGETLAQIMGRPEKEGHL